MSFVRHVFGLLAGGGMLMAMGCMLGPTAQSFRVARTPEGVQASLELAGTGRTIRGELVAVTDSGLLLLHRPGARASPSGNEGPRLVLILLRQIRLGRFAELDAKIDGSLVTDSKAADQLRLASRYPQGVRPDLMAALLAAYGQMQLEVVEPPER